MIHQWPHPVYSEMQSMSPQQPHNILMEGVTTDANIRSGCYAWGHDQQLSPPHPGSTATCRAHSAEGRDEVGTNGAGTVEPKETASRTRVSLFWEGAEASPC